VSANSSLSGHDLSPSAVFGQVILPRRGQFVVLFLEATVLLAIVEMGVFGVRGFMAQQQLNSADQVSASHDEEKKVLEARLKARFEDHRRASLMAGWMRRNLPMQPLALAILESIPAGVTLTRLDAELVEGGAPQMTIRVAIRGDTDTAERVVGTLARTLFKYGLRIVDQPIPQRLSNGVEAAFSVQFPALDEWEGHP
jgi:hypothetical protein